MQDAPSSSTIRKLAIIGNHLPRRCGIAKAAYERLGDVNNVAFPCGYTLGADGDQLNLYYGAADTSIALATGSVSGLIRWLDHNASAPGQA